MKPSLAAALADGFICCKPLSQSLCSRPGSKLDVSILREEALIARDLQRLEMVVSRWLFTTGSGSLCHQGYFSASPKRRRMLIVDPTRASLFFTLDSLCPLNRQEALSCSHFEAHKLICALPLFLFSYQPPLYPFITSPFRSRHRLYLDKPSTRNLSSQTTFHPVPLRKAAVCCFSSSGSRSYNAV